MSDNTVPVSPELQQALAEIVDEDAEEFVESALTSALLEHAAQLNLEECGNTSRHSKSVARHHAVQQLVDYEVLESEEQILGDLTDPEDT